MSVVRDKITDSQQHISRKCRELCEALCMREAEIVDKINCLSKERVCICVVVGLISYLYEVGGGLKLFCELISSHFGCS